MIVSVGGRRQIDLQITAENMFACNRTNIFGSESLKILFANVHFDLGSGGCPVVVGRTKWCLVATSLEGFSVTSRDRKGTKGAFEAYGKLRVLGALPGTRIKVVLSGRKELQMKIWRF